jgi:DNA-binding transcriptional regulator YiaG
MRDQRHNPILTGVLALGLGLGTSSALELPANIVHATDPARQTTAGAPLVEQRRTGAAISELRRLSGLTWAQVACLLSVSPRAVHFWASDRPMTMEHEARLNSILAVVRTMDHGSAEANRHALLTKQVTGNSPFDLLQAGQYEDARRLLGHGSHPSRLHLTPLSVAASAARTPRPPGELVDAVHDGEYRDVGRSRPARSTKVRT